MGREPPTPSLRGLKTLWKEPWSDLPAEGTTEAGGALLGARC